jgi:F0F1-type ATP synthase alpha subunit
MAKFAQGAYTIKNSGKYVGHGTPRYRSSWEWAFMNFCDTNEHIQQWSSEPVRIPYRHPLTGKMTTYVPDFIVTYRGPNNTMRAELIEIKPKKQSMIEDKQSQRDRAVVAVNYAKWDAATKWAKNNGLVFRIITEDDIFKNGRK